MKFKFIEGIMLILIALLVGVIIFVLIEKNTKKRALREFASTLEEGGRTIYVDGIRLFIREAGEGSVPLLMIHGFLESSDNFQLNINELSKSRKVIAVDLPGFANSDKDIKIDYSREHLALLLNRMMNQLGYDHYDLLGHSLGGEIALHIAINHPSSIDSLILVDAAGYQSNRHKSLPPWLVENIFLSYPMQKYLVQLSLYNNDIWNKDVFMKAYAYNAKIPGSSFMKFSRDNRNADLSEPVKNIKMPVLILWGAEDRLIPVSNAERFHQEISTSEIEIFAHCGHLPFVEYPDRFNKSVAEFLRKKTR